MSCKIDPSPFVSISVKVYPLSGSWDIAKVKIWILSLDTLFLCESESSARTGVLKSSINESIEPIQ